MTAVDNPPWLKEPSMPNLVAEQLHPLDVSALVGPNAAAHKPRVLMLYGSLRPASYSRLLTYEAARVLDALGADVRVFDADGLPLVDDNTDDKHPKVQELRESSLWSEAQAWC